MIICLLSTGRPANFTVSADFAEKLEIYGRPTYNGGVRQKGTKKAGNQTRTDDPFITSEVLYQLS